MARYTGPKDRLSRREGYDLFGKGSKLTRLTVPPGIHGPKGSRRPSAYALQLREKQKVKRMYGMLERQFRNYIQEAFKTKGNTGEKIIRLLESRLDNVIFRLGFAPTRPAARQIVSHNHVLVNGKKLNIPSYRVKLGDVVSLDGAGAEIPSTKKLLDDDSLQIPKWLEKKAIIGKIKRLPTSEDVSENISTQDLVEFYSK